MRASHRLGLLLSLLLPTLATADAARKTPQQIAVPPPPISIPIQMMGPAPTDITLRPASPTILTVSWSPAPGAVRYLISRNGAPDVPIEANAGFLQGGHFQYGDVARRPATFYTYSVVAIFPAPTLPHRSVPVQILMPTAFAPANLRATISGPNSVNLFWNGRPEATGGYRIIRNGGNSPAVSFDVGGVSFVDQNAPTGPQYSYIICSLIKMPSGETIAGEYSAPAMVNARAFNVLAVGDSVMWGQGLRKDDKFTSKTKVWIQSQIGVPVSMNVIAHSGAVTFPDPSKPILENYSYDGEVPSDFPTIAHQIDLASTPGPVNPIPANQIDLVLVDGCANNINIVTILMPYPDDNQLSSDITGYCTNGMINILNKTIQAFPNADVIVTGYFRLISMQTDARLILPLFGFLSQWIPPDPFTSALGANGNLLQLRMAARSDLFFQQSNVALQTAVNIVNGMPFPGRTRFNQIHFAPINPALENSYAAPHTWQWLIPSPPLYQDDVYSQRHSACDVAANGPPDQSLAKTPMCYAASLGHPNVAGAQAFTDAITSKASSLIPQWRAARFSTVTASGDTLVLAVQPMGETPDGATIVITAIDPVSNVSLAGGVQFNNANVGALGMPLRYSFQEKNPADILVGVQVPGHVPHYFTIPVRTVSLSLNVANSATLVTATDSVTGRVLTGNVTINPNSPSAVTAAIGQPISFSACAPTKYHIVLQAGQPLCGGIVHVPYYPDVQY